MEEQAENRPLDATAEFVCISTFLPIRRWRDVIPFLRMSSRVQKQLSQTPGLIRHEVRAKFLRKEFWTFSIWKDNESVDAFVRAEPHRTAMTRFEEWAEEGAAFVRWTSSDESINWNEAMQRLTTSHD